MFAMFQTIIDIDHSPHLWYHEDNKFSGNGSSFLIDSQSSNNCWHTVVEYSFVQMASPLQLYWQEWWWWYCYFMIDLYVDDCDDYDYEDDDDNDCGDNDDDEDDWVANLPPSSHPLVPVRTLRSLYDL